LDADTKPTVIPLRKKPRPPEQASEARANNRAGAVFREQAAGYSTREKLAVRGEGPFCFRVYNPVDALEAWTLANDAQQPASLDDAP
jgi:hypothetical protein